MSRRSRTLRVEPLEDRTTPTAVPDPGPPTPAPSALDPAFGTEGIAEIRPINPADTVYASTQQVLALPDGRVLVLGELGTDGPFVERLNADGTPDPTFGTGGRAALIEAAALEVDHSFADLAVTPDGGVVAVGYSRYFVPNDLTTHLLVVKLTADGT